MLIVKMSKTLSANKLSFDVDFDFDLLFNFITTNYVCRYDLMLVLRGCKS